MKTILEVKHLLCHMCEKNFTDEKEFLSHMKLHGFTPNDCFHYDSHQGRDFCCNPQIASNKCLGVDCGKFENVLTH